MQAAKRAMMGSMTGYRKKEEGKKNGSRMEDRPAETIDGLGGETGRRAAQHGLWWFCACCLDVGKRGRRGKVDDL